jgi:LPS export ABC transporter protein LptC
VVPQGAKESASVAAPDVMATNIETIFVDSSYTKAILRAKIASIFNNPPITILRGGLSVEFLSKESKKRLSLLTADSAVVDEKTKNMTAFGHVVVVSDSSQSRLETEVLNWDNARQKVYSKEFVRITSPLESVTGVGFESDIYLHNYVIYKVSGEKR